MKRYLIITLIAMFAFSSLAYGARAGSLKGKKGSIIINDTWFGDVVKINIGERSYELKKRNYTKIFSYEIENISDAILNNLRKVPSPGMSLEETLLNTKILEKWFNA